MFSRVASGATSSASVRSHREQGQLGVAVTDVNGRLIMPVVIAVTVVAVMVPKRAVARPSGRPGLVAGQRPR